MAHESSPKSRVISELSRSRQSSPYDDNVYMTATGTSFQDVLHSTPLRDSLQHAIPPRVDNLSSQFVHDDNGSTDMSIEVGRGAKGQSIADISSEGIFNFGNDDSRYEVTATPPIPPRNGARKADASLRREASVRRATESVKASAPLKRTVNGWKARAVSDLLPKASAESDNSHNARDFAQFAAPVATRNTRFVTSRRSSTNDFPLPTRFVASKGLDHDRTPQRTANMNATIQSTTFTANQSFMLPDMTDITELVSGVQRDGAAAINRGMGSRSRFTSGTFKPQPHRTVESIPLPHEEKVIFGSLQTVKDLKDRISELEAESMEAQNRANHYKGEVIGLRSRLQLQPQLAVSEAGSDEETMPPVKSSKAAGRVEASLKAVQDRFNRSELKVSTLQISLQRVAQERDALVTQIAAAYFSNEELMRENEEYGNDQNGLLAEISKLKEQVEALKIENETLRAQMRTDDMGDNGTGPSLAGAGKARKVPGSQDESQGALKGKKRPTENATRVKESPIVEEELASKIEREVRRHRDEAAARERHTRRASDRTAQSTVARSKSKSKQRTSSTNAKRDPSPQRTVSAPPDLDLSETESTTELDMTYKSRRSQNPTQSRRSTVHTDFEQDITMLSDLDDILAANMRKRIEEEHRAGTQQKPASTSAAGSGVRRKSSLKSINEVLHGDTGRFSIHSGIADEPTKTGKTVRVQSPHISEDTLPPQSAEADTGDISILSNTSRRRRRASSTEGMTSAFILPDITMHLNPSLSNNTCIAHDAANCTACAAAAPGASKPIEIPQPTPVSAREIADDITDPTLRPSQPAALALATVIKLLEDEITHLKLHRDACTGLHTRHDPAVSKRRRLQLRARIDRFNAEIDRRSDQVYALYDVLEAQRMEREGRKKKQGGHVKGGLAGEEDEDVEETLMSVGIDPVELSGRLGRGAPLPVGLDGADMWSEDSGELPWEGLSDAGSEE